MPYLVLNLERALQVGNQRRALKELKPVRSIYHIAQMLSEKDPDTYDLRTSYQHIKTAATKGVRSLPEEMIVSMCEILIITRAELIKYDLK